MKKNYLIIFFFCFCSCSDSTSKRDKAVLNAHILLTQSRCQEAIDSLEGVGRDAYNTDYLQVLSSAYACRAGFSEPIFYGVDLANLDSGQTALFGSLSRFSTSLMTSPYDRKFSDLQTAIDILLYAGSLSVPKQSDRTAIFGSVKSSTMGVQLLYMIFAQLGKYVFYYGNANPTDGEKGTGSISNGNPNLLTNECFFSYETTDPVVNAVMTLGLAGNGGGPCEYGDDGHPLLFTSFNSLTVTRMCQGIILVNNFLDIVTNIAIDSIEGDVSSLPSTFGALCTSRAELAGICDVRSQAVCEESYSEISAQGTDILQMYFYLIFELNFI